MRRHGRASNSRAPLIAGVVLAVAMLGGVNYAMQRNTPASTEHDEHGDEGGASPQATSPTPAPVTSAGQQLMDLGDDKTFGSPDARNQVTIGWQMTPQVQADPSKVYNGLQMAQQAMEHIGHKVRVRVVNVDANPSVPAGISVDGKVEAAPEADGTLDPAKVQRAFAEISMR